MSSAVGTECPCGEVHELPAEAAKLISELGPLQKVTLIGAGTWRVPRVWIAAHGLKATELPALAERHGWERV